MACCTNTDSNITHKKDQQHDHNSSLSLKPSSNLELLVNQFYNATPENVNDLEENINACSLNKNFDYPQHSKNIFDIIAISETIITKNVSLLTNLNLNNYSFEFTPTETYKKKQKNFMAPFFFMITRHILGTV